MILKHIKKLVIQRKVMIDGQQVEVINESKPGKSETLN